jgi:hypothetical protein
MPVGIMEDSAFWSSFVVIVIISESYGKQEQWAAAYGMLPPIFVNEIQKPINCLFSSANRL